MPRSGSGHGATEDRREFNAHERISALFSIHVTAVAIDSDIDFEASAGKPASFEVKTRGQRRAWTGICKELDQVTAEESGLSTYAIEIVPALWLATQRRNHRMFSLPSAEPWVIGADADLEPDAAISGARQHRRRTTAWWSTSSCR